MQTFLTAREAKEYLVQGILSQADCDDVSLSDIERKMLYFSETAWTLPDMAEISYEFDRCYDQSEYEQKIAKLVGSLLSTPSWGTGEKRRWSEAIRILKKEDHYILALVGAAGRKAGRKHRTSDPSLVPNFPSPFATPEQQRAQTLYAIPVQLMEMIRNGFSPRRDDPTAWYERVIRAVGGVILLLLIIVMVVVGWVNALSKR